MANVRCTPLGTLTHDLADSVAAAAAGRDDFDWYDPQHRMAVSVSCVSGAGRSWLHRTGAFESLDRSVECCLDEAERRLGDDSFKCVDAIVDVAYSYCGASVEGMRQPSDDAFPIHGGGGTLRAVERSNAPSPFEIGSRTRIGVENAHLPWRGHRWIWINGISLPRAITVIKFKRAMWISHGRRTGTPARNQLTECKILLA